MKVKNIIRSGLISINALNLLNKLTRKRVAILRYHSIQDDPHAYDAATGAHITHSTKDFQKQMELISRNYRPISMDDLLAYLKEEKDVEQNSVVVTFDDGFKDNIELAVPILNHYGVPATFYVTARAINDQKVPFFVRIRHAIWTTKKDFFYMAVDGENLPLNSRENRVKALQYTSRECAKLAGKALDKRVIEIESALDVQPFQNQSDFMMNWDDVRKMKQDGHIVGSHTMEHPNLAYIDDKLLNEEIVESKKMIESEIKSPVLHFSYPNPGLSPQWNENTKRIIKDAAYETAVISAPGSVTHESDPYTLNRVYVPDNEIEFLWYLDWALIGRAL